MLVLSRLKDEDIIIGSGADAIIVKVVDIRGDKVRLGIMAPPKMPVHRRETYEAIMNTEGKMRSGTERPITP